MLFVFVGCKKDKKKPKPIDQTIISTTWLTVGVKQEYFNETGSKLFEHSATTGPQYKFSKTSNTVRITENNQSVEKTYQLEQSKGKNYVVISSGTETERYEIIDYTDKTMSWKQEKSNQTYEDGKLAAKLVTQIDFHCPCRD